MSRVLPGWSTGETLFSEWGLLGISDGPSLSGLLLFADALVLVSQSESGLQAQLNVLHELCVNRDLTVNLAKTKAIVFH